MLIMALVVVGTTGLVNLGVDRFPSVDLPTVSVRTTLPGGSPEETENEITRRIEEAVNTVEGIDQLRSVTGAGNSIVTAQFKLNRNIDTAAQDVRDRVAAITRDLPETADPPVISKLDNDSAPVLTVALSGPRSSRELTELADKIIKVQLERSTGVGRVSVGGGLARTINIWLDADRLAAYKLPVTAVRDAVARQNLDVPAGNVTGAQQEQVLRTMGRLTSPTDFNDLIVANIGGTPVRIRDIGSAEDGTAEARSVSRINGEPTVIVEVQRQAGANTIEVIEAAKANLLLIADQLPPDVRLDIIRDQSNYIYAALHEINFHLIAGSILACLVVLLFVRSWRSTLIAGVAIPTSLLSTFGVMWALDFTLNGVTMLALVLMVGVVIDDAIVVLENIFRYVEEKKIPPMQAARDATAEIGLAVLATTFSLVVIFVPVSFMSSISGRFLYQFGITAAVAVLVSLLVSFTLTPMMSARLLHASDAKGGHGGDSRKGLYSYVDAAYVWMLTLTMRHRAIAAVIALLVIASAVPLYGLVKQEYVPGDVDEAEFTVSLTAPEGTNLAAMDDVSRSVEKDIASVRGVVLVQSRVGGSFLGAVNNADIFVRIEPHENRRFSFTRLFKKTLRLRPQDAFIGNYTQREVMQQIRAKLRAYPDIRGSVRNIQSFNIGGGNFDIDFVIRGPELERLAAYAEELRDRAQKIEGIVDADTTLKLNQPELRVVLDRARAADLGLDAREVGTALRLMVGGDLEVSRFRDVTLNEDYDVRLRLSEKNRNDPGTLEALYITRSGGGVAQLAGVAKLEQAFSPSRIDRLDRQRSARLRAGVAPGYAQADRIEALRDSVKEMGLAPGYSTLITGRGRELETTFTEFLWAFLLSVILMYMILAAQFESLTHPFTILLSLPLSVPFALLSLWATGGTLNLYSALGILVLFGVVKKNSILQIDHMNQLRAAGMPRAEAIIEGNRDRFRPILMTTLSLVAGMIPLLVGTGPGAEERQSIAIVVVGGQTLSLLLTLLVTPVVYSYFDDFSAAMRRGLKWGDEHKQQTA